jgi:uncharacterized membrane protein YphA (DoxX/SURF4 family)
VAGLIAAGDVLFRSTRRVSALKLVVVSGLLGGLFFSFPLWTGPRLFPSAPLFPTIAAPPLLDTILFAALVASLTAALAVRTPVVLRAAVVLAIVLAIEDQMRWQPWFYQYCFMLAALALYSWPDEEVAETHAVLNTCRLIVASLYWYSGLQKLNPEFTGWVLPWMLRPLADVLPPAFKTLPRWLGLVVPLLEIGIGIGLVTPRLRRWAMALALMMLVFVLVTLGPLGNNWNKVVWPWNVAMALFVVILFWRTDDVSFRDIVWVRNWPLHTVVLIVFLVLPALSFVNLWDSYPSASLYSGNTNRARLFISGAVKNNLPLSVQRYVTAVKDTDRHVLDFHTWSFQDLGVPPYPEARVFKAITLGICRYAAAEPEVFVVIRGKRTLFNRDDQSVFNCADLRLEGRRMTVQGPG